MERIVVDSVDELEAQFKHHLEWVTDQVMNGIKEAFESKKRTAILFEIQVGGDAYTLTLQSVEWAHALAQCVNYYRTLAEYNKAIDSYELQKEILKELS